MSELPPDENAILLSLSDFKRICKKWKKPIFQGALIGAAIAVSFSLLSPVKYTSEASFYEKAKNTNGSNHKNAALLLLGEDKENSAVVMLKSPKILQAALKKLGYQATVEPYSIWPKVLKKPFKHLNYARKHLIVEGALLLRSPYPSIQDFKPEITAKDVSYPGEIPLYLNLHFTSPTEFTVTDTLHGHLGEGQLGVPFTNSQMAFTLTANAADLKYTDYVLTLEPLQKLAKSLAKDLKVVSDYKDKSFITLTLHYPNRQGSSLLLNAIMDAYRDHLLQEHHHVVANQVAYLRERRQAMEDQLATLMEEHAEKLSAHAGNLELLIATQQNLQKKLLSIDLETKHIQKALDEGSYLKAHCCTENDPPFVHQAIAEIRVCRQQCDSIDLALGGTSENISHITEQEFQGINLETAKALYISYSRELHEAEAEMLQNQFIVDKIGHPDFELSSLSAVLNDPIGHEIVKKASAIALSMKDQSNRTQRELERLNQDLELQRNFLTLHLQEVVDLLKLRTKLLRSKIHAIQEITFELLQQKISLHEKHLLDYASSKLNSLKHERVLIHEQKQALQQEFEKLPGQWAAEKLIDLSLKTEGSLMQHIGSLIESKNIADHLEMSLSAPFDLATSPIHPRPPYLILFGIIGAFLGALSVIGYRLIYSVKNGIEATEENLQRMGQHVSGAISHSASENNLETIRHLIAYQSQRKHPSKRGHSLLLLKGNQGDYSRELATLLSKQQAKVMILPISFDVKQTTQDTKPGLLSYLEGSTQELNIEKGNGFDILPTGGTSLYSNELLGSTAFQQLLNKLLNDYDWIIAVSQASILSAEAERALPLFDGAAITVTDEKLHELQHLFALNKRISFVFSSNL
ncbi:MAG: hypothetical protein ACXWM7_04565 [Parachlamydiaceae bacterium]